MRRRARSCHDMRAGNDLIHVPIGIKHAVRADAGEKIISVGGPSPADRHLLKNVGKLPKKYDF